MLTSSLLLMGLVAAGGPGVPDVVGADRPLATTTWVSERGDPDSAGDTTATCRAYRDFAVVVFDAPLTKGIERVEVRDRAAGVTTKAVCATDFKGPARTLVDGKGTETGYFLAVKGPLVLMRGDDGFGAHDRLALYRARDGALLLDTIRYEDRPARLSSGKGAAKETVEIALRLALKVGCDPRTMAVADCLARLKRDNGAADDVFMTLDVKRACRGVPAEANLQLGVDGIISVDDSGARTRIIGGDVVCSDEP